MESCFNRNLGFTVTTTDNTIRKDAYWFGEAQSRVVVTVAKENRNDFMMLLEKMETTVTYLGTVTSGAINIDGENWGTVEEWKEKYDNAIGNMMK
jgi:phosphoribosylformylglycinamidine synthase subunit PurL